MALKDRCFLSARSERATRPSLSYFQAFLEARANMYSEANPGGNIIMSVAENMLSADLIQERLQQVPALPQELLGYQNMRGVERLRRGCARLLENTFMQGISVDPDHLSCLAGCGAVIEALFHCISSAGDGVLIPAPYYPAFDNDLEVKCGVFPVSVHLDEQMPMAPQLDAAAQAACAAGRPISALLITQPNNPLGTMYSRDTLDQMLAWCCNEGVHFVSDEIYGNSVFGDNAKCVSVEVLARQAQAEGSAGGITLEHPERVPLLTHIVWGFSKDFSMSGLRVGCLHTRNTLLSCAFDNISYFAAVSNQTQWSLSELLDDGPWLQAYLAENTRRLRASWDTLSGALTQAGIPYVAADSAMFCWADLRAGLLGPGWKGERELWTALHKEAGVLLTPGEQCHGSEPGFFRFCWAWMPHSAMKPVVDRIARLLAARVAERTAAASRQQPEVQEGEADSTAAMATSSTTTV